MKVKSILPFGLLCLGLSLTGCGNNSNTEDNTTMIQDTTKNPALSNNINGVFDGYRYNTDNYNMGTTYDNNYNNGYKKDTEKFDGMKGSENIRGNQKKNTNEKLRGTIKSDMDNIYDDGKNMYNDIKNTIRN